MGKRYFSPTTMLSLRRSALKVNRQIGIRDFKNVNHFPPVIGHVTRRMRQGQKVKGQGHKVK